MKKEEYLSLLGFLAVLILVGVSFLSPQTTGNIIKETERAKYFYGVYSFSPNFKIKTGLDFSIYDNIAKDLQLIIGCVASGRATESCIAERQFTNELKWELDCDKGEQRVFYDIAKLYDDCLKSPDTNCVCSLELGKAEYIEKNKLSGSYTFTLSSHEEGTYKLANGEETLSYAFEKFSSSYAPLISTYTYKDNALAIEAYFQKTSGGKDYLPTDFKGVMLLKQTKNGQITLNPVGMYSKSLTYPGTIPVDWGGNNDNPPPCSKPQQNVERFCVIDERKNYLVYDEIEGKVLEKPITIKFAAYMPDTPPAPLENIKVEDAPKTSKLVIVSWDASTASDVAFYKIYRASSSHTFNSPTAELPGKTIITTFSVSGIIPAASLPSFENCVFNLQTKKCAFGQQQAVFEQEKLYAFPNSGKTRLFVFLPVEQDAEYAFSVTAVDANGNEIDNVKASQKLPPPVVKASVDDLPPLSEGMVPLPLNLASFYSKETQMLTFPSFTQPTKNIDNSPTTDFKDVVILYKKTGSIPAGSTLAYLDDEIIIPQPNAPLSIPFPAESATYQVVVVARDQANNPQKGQFTAEEIGATVMELTIIT
jgi:hypothetical protein